MEGRMKRLISILLSFFFIFSGQIAFCGCFDKIKRRYSSFSAITLKYERYVISQTLSMLAKTNVTDIAEGKIYIKPPYFIRIEQKRPTHQIVIGNDKTVWWYIPDEKKAYRYDTKRFGKEIRIIRDIFGMGDLKQEFFISFKKGFFVLRPRSSWQDVDRIEVYVDKGCVKINKIKIYNLVGSITCFRIKAEEAKIPNGNIFQFIPPPGTRIIQK